MIDRYTRPEMGRVWSDAHKYELWCRIEILVLEAHAAGGHRARGQRAAGAGRPAAAPGRWPRSRP